MFRKSLVFVASGMMVFFLVTVSSADVPHMINYQGKLTTASGGCLDDTVQMTFSIYPDTLGSPAEWSETQTEVIVREGVFNVLLGSVDTIPSAVFDGNIKYLGVRVEADPEMRPLKPMVSVAYAYRAVMVDGCGESHWSVTDSVLYTNNFWGIARGGADNALLSSTVHTAVNLGVACTTGTNGHPVVCPTVSGGYGNVVKEEYGTVGGGEGNAVTDEYGVVGGGINNTAHYMCTVSGGNGNVAIDDQSTVGGGGSNTASNYRATVAGGGSNLASGDASAIGGGEDNEASGNRSTVSGGENNRALSDYTWIGGGQNNTTKGYAAAVPGGAENTAEGDYSYACGRKARALHEGTFVWADASSHELESTAPNQFLIRSSGGARIYSDADQTAGVTIHAGASAWAVNSDRNLKENFTAINGQELLEKIVALPITEWNYRTQSENIKHIGPVAQDFHAIFGLGDDNVTISTIDPAGVALAGVKELAQQNQELRQIIEELRQRIGELEKAK